MTRISFTTSIGLYDTYTLYWNGEKFVTTDSSVEILDPEKMWDWLEEHAPIIADCFMKRVTIENL